MVKENPKYKRVLLKLSGEAFSDEGKVGLNAERVAYFAKQITGLLSLGVQVAVVVGAGNFVRGCELMHEGFDRITADQMGMLSTVLNGLALRDSLAKELTLSGVKLLSAIPIQGIVEPANYVIARKCLDKNKVVIYSGGTGNPCVTTDTTASIRAIEISADVILKATKVDGVYSADPAVDKNAKRYDTLNYEEVLKKKLAVMDLAAICLCQNHDMPLCIFDMNQEDILRDIVMGKGRCTTIVNGDMP